MTVYWWNHWFWITAVIVSSSLLVSTYPLSPILETNAKEYNHNSNNNRKGSLGFALDEDATDSDDIFSGNEKISDSKDFSVVQRIKTKHNVTRSNYTTDLDGKGLRNDSSSSIGKQSDNRTAAPQKDIDSPEAKNSSNLLSTNSSSTKVTKLINTSPPQVLVPSPPIIQPFPGAVITSTERLALTTTTNSSLTTTTTTTKPITNTTSTTSGEDLNATAVSEEIEVDGQLRHKAPFTLENVNREEELVRAESEHRTRKSKVLSAEYRHHDTNHINFSSDTKSLLARFASVDFDDQDEGNVSSEALSIQRAYFIDAGTISGICFAVLAVCCAVAFVGIIVYRRRYLNKPQTLSEPDSSVYIDDSTIRDNSDEMYSLDNDSFLNSLEAMTIQNYWTDTVKHTKL